ncbi:CatB-related O-acetyltransferase [Aerococcus kribbianus]|uniref:CatB-related O-acetyltransferase n=1 Tax=Aerococcus kribbianus TaxID=2999064 RepID=A0A9X3FMP5_9LACT|nr:MULTISPECIES: CatB-related O-acetyltransferase [unclassified Aerococcus]MCZ0717300.1 CatB-related O-acetyltransferase [Aerococcus sp. YH-aer221]MCZ0725588.1 CatB-related O-acetyltransferase [Aerococcus sp. YH-aer222]
MTIKGVLKKAIKTLQLKMKYGQRIDYRYPLYVADDVRLNDVHFGIYNNVAHDAEINRSVIGDRTSIGRFSKIESADIGKFCSISWDVTIGATGHPMTHLSTHAFSYRKLFGLVNKDGQQEKKRVKIANDVWIGCQVVIMPGVTIGNGAIVGAGSIVTHDVKPYEVVVGNPAKVKKLRFDPATIAKLEKINWWDLSDEQLQANSQLFTRDLDQEIIKELRRLNDV